MTTRRRANESLTILLLVGLILSSVLYILPEESRASQSDLSVSVADAGIQSFENSGLPTNTTVRVEDFNSRALQSNSAFSFSGPAGAWSGTGWIQSASVYGGAGGSGRHATANNATLVLDMPESGVDYRYLGFWWSAGNTANYIDLVEANGTIGATFSASDLASVVGSCGPNPPTNGYCGNPNSTINGTSYATRPVPGEQFAFIHLRYAPGFRKVQFRGAGFEFDNVTVSQIIPAASETETFTETFNPYTLSAPGTLVVDPRDTSLPFPGITLGAGSGETSALLCITQVTNASGTTEVASPSIEFLDRLGGQLDKSGNTILVSGSRQDVIDSSSDLIFESTDAGGRVSESETTFVRLSVTPQSNIGISGCSGEFADTEVLEIRPLSLFINDQNLLNLDRG